MNLLFILLLALALWRGWRGMKVGLVEEAGRLLLLVITLFVLSLGILLYTSIKSGDTKNIILSVIVIVITGLVVRLLKFVIKSLSALAHLPLIGILNGLLGLVIGVAEVVVVLWILYMVIANFDLGSFGLWITQQTQQSEYLARLHRILFSLQSGLDWPLFEYK